MGDSGGVAVINVDDFKFDMSDFKAALRESAKFTARSQQ